MRVNVIRLRRHEGSDRISERVFVVEADTLEALITGVDALNQIDPLDDSDAYPEDTPDE
jgi:hypothetical protein